MQTSLRTFSALESNGFCCYQNDNLRGENAAMLCFPPFQCAIAHYTSVDKWPHAYIPIPQLQYCMQLHCSIYYNLTKACPQQNIVYPPHFLDRVKVYTPSLP